MQLDTESQKLYASIAIGICNYAYACRYSCIATVTVANYDVISGCWVIIQSTTQSAIQHVHVIKVCRDNAQGLRSSLDLHADIGYNSAWLQAVYRHDELNTAAVQLVITVDC